MRDGSPAGAGTSATADTVAATAPIASGKHWVLIAAILGSSMAFIDSSVVNVAPPATR